MRYAVKKAYVATLRLFLFLIVYVCVGEMVMAQRPQHRPRIGVVLGGGGAKGAAHIGVLKYIEERGIPIDCVAGTSMGSIIGGLYSLGYSPEEMKRIISDVDWSHLMLNRVDPTMMSSNELALYRDYLLRVPFNLRQGSRTIVSSRSLRSTIISSLPSSFMGGSNVSNLFNSLSLGYNDSISFDSLPIPFSCVATDIVTGEAYIFRRGVLPMAMRASMAIPGIFDPVRLGEHLLLDGGMVNNFPTDICVDSLGADIVIGIEVAQELDSSSSNLNSLPQIANQLMQIAVSKNKYDNRQKCDIYIRPDMTGYNMLSFNAGAIDTLVRRGYEQAQQHADEFAELRRMLDDYGPYKKELQARPAEAFGHDTIYVTNIVLNGISKDELMQDHGKYRWLLRRSGINEGPITGDQLDKALSLVKGTGAFSDIVYNLHPAQCPTDSMTMSCYTLTANLKENEPHVFALGLRYDWESSATILFKIGLNQRRIAGAKLQVAAELNYSPRFAVTASYEGLNFATLNLEYAFRADYYNMWYNNESGAKKLSDIWSKNNYLRLYLSEFQSRMFNLRIGVQEESIYYYNSIDDFFRSFGAFASLSLDTRNRPYLADRGMVFSLEGNVHRNHDDRYRIEGDAYGSGSIAFSSIVPLGGRFAFVPHLYVRMITPFDEDKDMDFYQTLFGGMMYQRHSESQLPFVGVIDPQYLFHDAAVARIDLRVHLFENSYVSLMGNVIGGTTKSLLQDGWETFESHFGFGVQYALRTIVGPLTFSLHWSDITDKWAGYISLGYDF